MVDCEQKDEMCPVHVSSCSSSSQGGVSHEVLEMLTLKVCMHLLKLKIRGLQM